MEMRRHSAHALPPPHLLQTVPSDVIADALALLEDDDVDFIKLARVIESHPGMSALIIRTANSVTIGNPQPLQSIRHAMAFLGIRGLREALRHAEQNEFIKIDDRRFHG
ncbi:MAG TPA: HDOD domain-containing protein [Planctomicrobium sp.]|nr:HDOD domain-containing protein [Planctomicrobium sp.]